MKLDHIGFKLIMTDANGTQQLDFIGKKMYTVPKAPGVTPSNVQLPPPSFFRWGSTNEKLVKLFLKNYGSEDVQFKVNPRDDSDAEVVGELDVNVHRVVEIMTTEKTEKGVQTVGTINKLNLKVMGPGSTLIRIDGYILYS